MDPALGPVAALRRTAYLLERAHADTYRVKAYRTAAAVLAALPPDELAERAAAGSLAALPGVGPKTADLAERAARGEQPPYLLELEQVPGPDPGLGAELLGALRGDLHTHSDWSDGGSPIAEMAEAAAALGHDYVALTDHSPRLTVARGLSPERLRQQLDVIAQLNTELAPFRILTGIEVDILDDGRIDQTDELLDELDIVVASAHNKLRMASAAMTERMVLAIANPRVDVLGHCTGRLVTGKGRPESEFDAELVFTACATFGVAVEINSRPERLDPPRRLLSQAVELGCLFSIDTDAHAPGQLEWQAYGAARAAECGVPTERVINTWELDALLAWTQQTGPG